MPAFASPGVRQKNRIVVTLYDNLVFKPDAGDQQRTGCVVLNRGFVPVQMPDAIASLDLVDCAGPVFEKAVGLGSDALKVLGPVADRVVVDLDFKPSDYRLPRRVVRIVRDLVCGARLQCGGKVECWAWEANKNATILLRRIENLELQA